MNLTEQQYLDYMAQHGFPLDPTLTLHVPGHLDPESPEGTLANRLYTCATTAGWLYYHTHDSRKSTPGWPDVALAHPDGGPLYLWELKSARGQVSPAQRRWLEALAHCTHVETAVYRPGDWPAIAARLTRRAYP